MADNSSQIVTYSVLALIIYLTYHEVSCDCILPTTQHKGNGYGTAFPSTESQCVAKCQQESQCQGATYDGNCWRHSKLETSKTVYNAKMTLFKKNCRDAPSAKCGVDKYDVTKCPGWAKTGECKANRVWMGKNCAKSCKTCGVCPASGNCCLDSDPNCKFWAEKGECTKNNWMKVNCKLSCKSCGKAAPAVSPTQPTKPSSGGSAGAGAGGGAQCTGTKGNPQKYWRVLDMAIFISPTLSNKWQTRQKKNRQQMIRNIKVGLKNEMNKLYSYKMLGGIDIKYNMIYVNDLSNGEASWITSKRNELYGEQRDAAGVGGFCEFQKMMRDRHNGQWDLAMYLVDGEGGEGKNLTPGAAGRTMTIEGVCDIKRNWNCGIVHGKAIHENLVFDRLFAHETGHLVGFPHPPQYCNRDMMFSPGQYEVWSPCTVKKAKEIFQDAWKYPCMAYQCGENPKPTILPGGFSDADKKVLDRLCTTEIKDGSEWEMNAPKGAKGRPNSNMGIHIALWENPNWRLAKNVCKGIPCQSMKGGLHGVTRMKGKPCGVGKTCQDQGGVCQ